MTTSTNSSSVAPPPAQEVAKKDVREGDSASRKKLLEVGMWAGAIIVGCHLFGQCTVVSALKPDSRQDAWLLMKSPLPTLFLCLVYVASVTWVGPALMASRKPFANLRPLMMAYNAFQVVFSAYIFYEGGMGGWFGSYNYLCQPCEFSNKPENIRIMHAGYWYLFSKFVDFTDTIFFVLHKKYEHISLLHVVHHSLMPSSLWYGVRYQPGGHASFGGFVNSFVHVVMYGYYLLAAMGPKVRPYLWWKKYITTMQLVQFTIVFIHCSLLVFIECDVPPVLVTWAGGVAALMFVLFGDFYIKSYRDKAKKVMRNAEILSSNGLTNGVSKTTSVEKSPAEPNGKSVPILEPESVAVRNRGEI